MDIIKNEREVEEEKDASAEEQAEKNACKS